MICCQKDGGSENQSGSDLCSPCTARRPENARTALQNKNNIGFVSHSCQLQVKLSFFKAKQLLGDFWKTSVVQNFRYFNI